ncbi:MAG: PstS family phosphate ABC transporter substrate-binding protein [Gemmatimonadota bacterium]
MKRSVSTSAVLALALALACGGGGAGDPESRGAGEASQLSGEVKGDGSSTVFPIMEAVAEEFQRENPRVRVTVGISGTGGGFKRFCAGDTDVSNASRPITESELEACRAAGVEFVEFPIAFDGLSVVVNPANDFAQCVTVAELKRLWQPEAQGEVRRWSQVRSGWPNREIHLYGAGTDSGTYDYFTAAIVGEEGASRGDFTSSEDDNVLVQGVAGDPDALGFFGYAYFEENQDRLRLLPVDGGEGCVAPAPETITDGTYQPLSRPLFLYAREESLQRPEVRAFVDYAITNAVALVGETGYIPLTDELYRLARARVERGTTGSIYEGGGSQVGTRLEDLLAREAPPAGAGTGDSAAVEDRAE